jgi:glucan phosphorylase
MTAASPAAFTAEMPTLRLKQEIVLGIGGEMVLRALGFGIATYHLNDSHAALLPVTLLRRYPQAAASPEGTFPYDLQPVRERCVFTAHTPVDAAMTGSVTIWSATCSAILSIPRLYGVSAAMTRST